MRMIACIAAAGMVCWMAADDLSWRKKGGVLLFEDNFDSGKLSKWPKLSLNDLYRDAASVPREEWRALDAVRIVPAPLAQDASDKAVEFTVPRKLGTFRSELSLSWEPGFQERWYGVRIFVPADWVVSQEDGGDIVTQWHHILASERDRNARNFPPISVAIKTAKWVITNNYGEIAAPRREITEAPGNLEPGKWVAWVFHMRWSPGADGLTEAWKDGRKVMSRKGPNTYQTTKPHTPYWKIGIYHPEWKASNAEKFRTTKSAVVKRVIVEDDVKMGSEKAGYRDVAPPVW